MGINGKGEGELYFAIKGGESSWMYAGYAVCNNNISLEWLLCSNNTQRRGVERNYKLLRPRLLNTEVYGNIQGVGAGGDITPHPAS